MMRFLLASIALLAASVSTATAASHTRSEGPPGHSASAHHALRLTLSPAPDDLALAEVGFHGRGRRTMSARSLHVAVRGALGDDYMASAWLGSRVGRRALVLVVNRPTSLLDLTGVDLALSWREDLGSAFKHVSANPITAAGSGPRSSFCSLTPPGVSLSPSALHLLGSRGTKLGEASPSTAVAQAYDLSCGRPSDPAFRQAVTGACSAQTSCEPAPAPPEKAPPGCGVCNPRPGYACPLVAAPAVCPAPVAGGTRQVSTGSY